MPNNPITTGSLLTERMYANPFYKSYTNAIDSVINPTIIGPLETLSSLRLPDVEPYFAFLNAKMLGFNIASLAFVDTEYPILLRTLGKYWQTRGASSKFIDYISYIKNVRLIYIPLWADSLDMPIADLTNIYGTELWNGGAWFPTTFFDVIYSLVDFPTLDEVLFRDFIYKLAPEHLVLRNLVGIQSATTELYLTAIPLQRTYSTAIATAVI